MSELRCPKCGRDNESDAVICEGCDYILDVSFLGDDITNEPEAAEAGEATRDDGGLEDFQEPSSNFGPDALILGKVDAEKPAEYDVFESETTGDFLTAPTAAGIRALSPTAVYIDAETKALLEPDAVLSLKEGTDPEDLQLSPFEHHVLNHINGERPVARIAALTGLSDEDLRICLTLIADKGVLSRVGTAKSTRQQEAESTGVREVPDDPDGVVGGAVQPLTPGSLDDAIDVNALGGSGEGPSPFASMDDAAPLEPEIQPLELPPEFVEPAPIPNAAVPSLPGQGATANPPAAPAPRASTLASLELNESDLDDSDSDEEPISSEEEAPAPERASKVSIPSVSAAAKTKAANLFDAAVEDILANKMSRALGYVRMGAELDPTNIDLKNLLENWGKAKQIASASKGDPEDVRLYKEAKAHEQTGDWTEAIKALEKALKVNPSAAGLHNQMGVLLATRKKDYTRAMSHLFRAVELDANNPAYKNNLGKVMAMSGSTGPVSPLDGGGSSGKKKSGRFARLFKKS